MNSTVISVVTPVYNSCRLIERTLQSLQAQDLELRGGGIEIQHIIVDGGSKDGTLERIKFYENPSMEVISEPDHGMYDALAKGLQRAKGDAICYLNAGDMFTPTALKTVAAIFSDTDSNWFTCASTHYCDEKMIVRADMPYRYQRQLIKNGVYGRMLPFIQQESTFWRKNLHNCIDFDHLRRFRLAGDHYLWWCFASQYELDVAHTIVSGFSINEGQLSENKEKYFTEMSSISGALSLPVKIQACFEKRGWRASHFQRLNMNPLAIRYDHIKHIWRRGQA